MRFFSRVISEARDARPRRFRRQVGTNKQHQQRAIPTLGRQGRLPCLPCLLGIGRERGRQALGREKAGARQGRGRLHGGYVLSLITTRE